MVTATPKKPTTRPQAKTAARPGAKRASSASPASVPHQPAVSTTATAKGDKKKAKPEKLKVVRDSFTIPKTEYAQIAALKKRALSLGIEIKKSELIRAGLAQLTAASDAALRKALGNVPTLKTGRPGKA